MSAQKTASDKCPCDYHDTPGYSPKGDPDAPLPKPPKGGTGAVYPDTPERICTGEGDRCKPYMDGPGWGWWNKWLDRMSGEQFNALLDKIEAMPDDDFAPMFPQEPESAWIPVTERLPEDGQACWIYVNPHNRTWQAVKCAVWHGYFWRTIHGRDGAENLPRAGKRGSVTHWLPAHVPAPPKDTQGRNWRPYLHRVPATASFFHSIPKSP